MSKVAHLIGNCKTSALYTPQKGLKITCNVPPFEVKNLYTTVMVDFKMMKSIYEGSVIIPGDWVLGARPKKWMEMKPDFYMKYARQIKKFYTVLPKYASTYTDFNCGHMATHYIANSEEGGLGCKEIHMYGFDSLFSFDTTSMSDAFLMSDRGNNQTEKLTSRWRPIWNGIFKEFKDTQFVLYYHKGDTGVMKFPQNVEVRNGTRKN
jgi:hypothetical protein